MSNAKKRLIGSIAVAFLISVVIAISQVSPSRAILPFLSQADTPIVQKDAGLEFEGFGTPNTGTITRTIFRGECSGEDPGSIKARFYSTTTPPAADRRVVIRNVSRGMAGDTAPYTDREYNKGRTSRGTNVAFGTSHRQQYFAVIEGLNNFEYEIKQGSSVLEQGTFTAEISRDEQTRSRNAICSDEKYCRDSEDTPLDKCETVRIRSRCHCPDKPNETFVRR